MKYHVLCIALLSLALPARSQHDITTGDQPENYAQYPDAFQFIKDVPVNWDDTKFLAAEPGDYVVINRKAKDQADWYVGVFTDENEWSIKIDCSFLSPNQKYSAVFYRDADNANCETWPVAA